MKRMRRLPACFSIGFLVVLAAGACLADVGAAAVETSRDGGAAMGERMVTLVLQLAVILCAAKILGFLCQRYLRVPDVLGELAAGIVLGPHLLGPWLGLFPAPAAGAFPITPELYGVATLASIILLYLAGLETDLSMFLRYSVVGSLVGVGGVAASFVLGDLAAVWAGLADNCLDSRALFLGTISTATSVGVTARVLSQRDKIDSPEGVTILAGAVVDDVLGIIILAVVVGVSRLTGQGGAMQWSQIGLVAAKAFVFWIVCTAVGMLVARRLSRILEFFGSRQTMATLSLGLALLVAGFAEKAGLAMIIGAYIMGLSLSRADAAHELRTRLAPVYNTFVGVFFAVMGMMVDLRAVKGILFFSVVYSLAAMVAKLLGCGLPALLTRFRLLGAVRIGLGMLPRGEVTLLVAGVGLSGGLIGPEIFGAAVMMTVLSTLVAPLLMVRLFDDRPGLRVDAREREPVRSPPITLRLPNREIAEFLLSRVVQMFEAEECYVYRLGHRQPPLYQIRKEDMTITARYENAVLILSCDERDREFARLILLEALASLIKTFEGLRQLDGRQDFRSEIMA